MSSLMKWKGSKNQAGTRLFAISYRHQIHSSISSNQSTYAEYPLDWRGYKCRFKETGSQRAYKRQPIGGLVKNNFVCPPEKKHRLGRKRYDKNTHSWTTLVASRVFRGTAEVHIVLLLSQISFGYFGVVVVCLLPRLLARLRRCVALSSYFCLGRDLTAPNFILNP